LAERRLAFRRADLGVNARRGSTARLGAKGRPVIEVLVADDHAVVRRGMLQLLSETLDLRVGGEAATADECVRQVQERRWAAVVLDLSIPGGTGLDLLAEIKRLRPSLPVLILTAHSEEQYAVRALRAGAAGFLNKESAPDQLVQALRKIVRGGKYVSPALAERLAFRLGSETDRALHESLSNREFQVLCRLASGKTVGEVAQEMALSVKTVSTYRARILEKMEMKTNAELTHYAIRNGLVQ
jgi:DNA-binding NarL/FixJ family response regulator